MGEYKPVEGDRVRVVFEGEVTASHRLSPVFELNRHFSLSTNEVVSVEKVGPPVEVFKPGSLVREKGRHWHGLITDDGYVYYDPSGRNPYSGEVREYDISKFTSESYELVELP